MNRFSISRLFHACILLGSTFLFSLGCSTGSVPEQSDTRDSRSGGQWETHLVNHHAKAKVPPRTQVPRQTKPVKKQPPKETIADLLAPDNMAFELPELPDPARFVNQLAEPVSNPEYRAFLLRERALQQHALPIIDAPDPGEIWELPEMRQPFPPEMPINNNENILNDINHPESKDPTLQIDLSAPSLPDDPTDAYMEHLMNEVRRMYAPVPDGIDIGTLRPELDIEAVHQIREMFGEHPQFHELLDDIERFQTKKPARRDIPRNIQNFIKEKRAFENNNKP